MVILETSVFSVAWTELLDPESYRLLQLRLLASPESGALIPVRWHAEGRGKRGGLRIIYYLATERSLLLLLLIHARNEIDDLTADQRKILRQVVEEELE